MQDCQIRPLTIAEVTQAQQLSTLSGWNQTADDWRRLLKLQPDGCYAAYCLDRLVGTVTTTEYEKRFGWVGMVLVHPDYRGSGFGKQLLQTGIDSLQTHGVATVKLDATPQGEPLYAKAGFQAEYTLERWEGTATPSPQLQQSFTPQTITLVTGQWDDDILDFDHYYFGADRSRLLRALAEEFPGNCLVCRDEDRVLGYMLGRRGARANYLGPWLAADPQVARLLFNAMLAHWPGEPIFVDINPATAALAIVQESGLQRQRSLLRMYLGSNDFPGKPDAIFGIAGPEIG